MAGIVPTLSLSGGVSVARIVNGMWQVSGAHGPIDPHRAVDSMMAHYDAGLTSFDMADIYGPAEQIYGAFINKLGAERGQEAVSAAQGLTKFVPRPGPMTRKVVETAIQKSLHQMGVASLDCVQFHWWDYSDRRYLEALGHLSDLRQEGVIRELSLTNFDTTRVEEIVKHGIQLSSNQVQYSLIDMRPAKKMAEVCQHHGMKLLTYGTLGGGLISEKYLGAPEPRSKAQLYTASLSKYKNMINAWGGWPLFQDLLGTLARIGEAHNASIANIATRYILDQPGVAGTILGVRFGVEGADHIQDNLRTFSISLTEAERMDIHSVLNRAKDLMALIGDCGDEYR